MISVNSLAFKRFLDIAKLLKLEVRVIGDNDASEKTIGVHIGQDDSLPTLEPQLVKANGLEKLNRILGQKCASDADLIDYMT
jgi:hypothetical protein